jgi:acetyltransferase
VPTFSGGFEMGIKDLDKIFNPKRIAVIGASNSEGSVGFNLFNNLIGVGFEGFVYPVNPFSQNIQGITAYPSITRIPWTVDLAIIATPAHLVPQVLEECGESGVTGIIIISSGFGEIGVEGKHLEETILKIKKTHNLKIIGPNCLGIIRPKNKLNATFANKTAIPGKVAFISQSGALCASVLDWAAHANIGFSYFVSVGGMVDVDYADLIDYFGIDPETRSIILFIEAIKKPRKFMSAARRFAGTKPIIVVKTGKSVDGAKAAVSHTGAISGDDSIYDSFFKRAGIVRVEEIADLFNCSEILSMQPPTRGSRLAIITNAGGPAVMAVDELVLRGGELASLSDDTINTLDDILPHFWSRTNPIDICEDASVERFRTVIKTCFNDKNADGYLIIYTPIGAADPTDTAKSLIELSKNSRNPILTCWLGEEDVREARDLLRRNGIPSSPTPEHSVATFMYMNQYARNLELLYETPEEFPIGQITNKESLLKIIKEAKENERDVLTEPESKKFLEAYGIPTATANIAKTELEAVEVARKIGYPIVMKILSPSITHKTDVNGVLLNIGSDSQVINSFNELVNRTERLQLEKVDGVTVQPMIRGGYELFFGSKKDPQFGSIILFGSGAPLNQTLARRMIEQTKAYKILLKGHRGRPPANIRLVEEALLRFSQLVIDYPQIKEIDVNPIIAHENEIIALDARIFLDSSKDSTQTHTHEHLIISPYPRRYINTQLLSNGEPVLLRPVRPEDESNLRKLFNSFSEDTMRFRFFQVIREISHKSLSRYCNIDYDREIVIVSEKKENNSRLINGMVSLVVEPDGESAEFAIVVGDPWQNKGLGSLMFDYIIQVGIDMGLKRIFGEILKNNYKMKHIVGSRGFEIEPLDEETCIAKLEL